MLCLCVYVRKTPEAGSVVVLSTQKYRLLHNKYGLSMSLLENWTLGYEHTHTHTGLLCINVYQHSLMQTGICIDIDLCLYVYLQDVYSIVYRNRENTSSVEVFICTDDKVRLELNRPTLLFAEHFGKREVLTPLRRNF